MSPDTIAFLLNVWKKHFLLPVECGRKILEYLPQPVSLSHSSPSIASSPSIPSTSSFTYNWYKSPTDETAYVQVSRGVSRGSAAENALDVDISDAFFGEFPFGFDNNDEEAIKFREKERDEELRRGICASLDAFPGGLGDTVLDGLSAEMLFSSEDILDEMLRGLVQTKFVPYSYKREVIHSKNHEAIYEAIRKNQKAMQNDAYSKLAYELYDYACKAIIYSLTNVYVSVKLEGEVVSATFVVTSFSP
jgi:hypothetical protein